MRHKERGYFPLIDHDKEDIPVKKEVKEDIKSQFCEIKLPFNVSLLVVLQIS